MTIINKENKGGHSEDIISTMSLTTDQKQQITESFNKMRSKEDLLGLLNYTKPFVYGVKAFPFEMKHVHFHAHPRANKNRYREFIVPKKSGGERIIHAPSNGLKAIQKCLNLIFQTLYEPHQNKVATGFVSERSIVDNAKIHAGSLYVYNIDLKDFFPSIDQARLWGRLKHPPFNLNEKNERLELNNLICSLCCQEMQVERLDANNRWQKVVKNVLPQGAPTSPTITNIICQNLDFYLNAVAKRFGLKYTRYADDITFSSMHNVYQKNSAFMRELYRITEDQKFHIKETKTRLQKNGYRQEVTGLLVNTKVNVQKRYIKQLRLWLYYSEHYGYKRAETYFMALYHREKGHLKKRNANMANVVAGKLEYLKMVKGVDNKIYLKLKSRFDATIKRDCLETRLNETVAFVSPGSLASVTPLIGNANKNAPETLRVNINSLDEKSRPVKLKRKIIIEKDVYLPIETFVDNKEKEEKEIDLTKHKPVDVTRFLLSFRSSEGLKFLTHDYDMPDSVFDPQTILQIAKKEFDELSRQFIVPVNLKARIHQFAFGDPKLAWWFNKVPFKINWNSPELLSWMNKNPNTHPINNEYFERTFISPFKKSIEIKSPELEYIIKAKLAENLESKYLSFDITLIDLDKANFYTNVDALQVGISYLIRAIKQRFDNSNKIKIDFSRTADDEGRKRIIKIVHVNSECTKPLDRNELFQGDLLEAEKAFFGICDWAIISKSPDNSCNKLNILFDINSDKQSKEKVDDSTIEGFTHVLTFFA